jgi:peroxin-4
MEWSPAWGLQSACRAIVSLLGDPYADSPLNCDAGKVVFDSNCLAHSVSNCAKTPGNMIRANDMVAYNSMARMYRAEHAVRAMPDF